MANVTSKPPPIILVLLCVLAVAVPWVFTAWTHEADAVKTLVYECGALLAGLLVVGCWLQGQPPRRLPQGFVVALTVWLGVHLLSYGFSAQQALGLRQLWRAGLLAVLALSTAVSLDSTAKRKALLHALAFGALGVCAYAFVQRARLDPVSWSTSPVDRVFSSIGNPNMLAGYCVLLFPLFGVMACAWRSWWLRIGYAALALAVLATLVFAGSRGGILGLLGMLVVGAILGRKWLLHSTRGRITAALTLLLLVAACWPLASRFAELRSLDPSEHGSANVRVVIWEGTAKLAADHWLLGAGPGSFAAEFPAYRRPGFEQAGVTNYTMHAHSELLEILAELGVLGLAAFLAVLVVLTRIGLRQLRANEPFTRLLAAGLLLGLVGLLAHNLVSVNLRWSTCAFGFWLLAGMLVSLESRPAEPEPEPLFTPAWRTALLALAVLGLAAAANHFSIKPFRAEIAYMQGLGETRRRNFAAAEAHYERAIALNPTTPRPRYMLGHSHFERRDYERALRAYRGLQALHPNFAQVRYNLAVCYIHRGRWRAALAEYEAQAAIGGLPANRSFAALMATLRRQDSEDAKLGDALQHLAKLQPKDVHVRTRLGTWHFQRHHYERARTEYRAALAVDPDYVPALNNLAGVHFTTGDFKAARAVCERLLAIEPQAPVPRVNLGKALVRLGQPDAARAHWRQVLAQHPDHPEARSLLERIGE